MISTCGRWFWTHSASRFARRSVPAPQPGPGQVLVRVHACGVCRTDLHVVDGDLHEPKLPLVHRPSDRRNASRGRGGGGALRGRAAGRDPVAGVDRRRVPLLPLRPREPLRAGPVHRLPARRGIRGAGGRRPALLLRAPGGLSGSAGGAAAVRRADRLPVAAALRRRGAGRPVWLRRVCPHHLPGGGAPGPARVRADAAGRRARPSASRSGWAPRGRETPRAAPRSPRRAAPGCRSRSMRRSSSPRPESWSRSRCARSLPAGPWSARAST